MYPEIRVIGTIQTIEDAPPGKSDVLLTLTTPLREGRVATFRVRAPRENVRDCTTGQDVFVLGEIDETGAITLTHRGVLRALANPSAPRPSLQTATPSSTPATASAASTAVNPTSVATASPPSRAPSASAVSPRPSTSSRYSSFGNIFRGQSTAFRPTAAPTPTPRPQPVATATHPSSVATKASSPSPALASPERPAVRSFASASRSHTSSSPHSGSSSATSPSSRPSEEDTPSLATVLEDEIPW